MVTHGIRSRTWESPQINHHGGSSSIVGITMVIHGIHGYIMLHQYIILSSMSCHEIPFMNALIQTLAS